MRPVKVTHVPEHVRFELLPVQAEALHKVLSDVADDQGFVLNEMEDEVVTALIEQLNDDGESSYTR